MWMLLLEFVEYVNVYVVYLDNSFIEQLQNLLSKRSPVSVKVLELSGNKLWWWLIRFVLL